MSDFQRNLQNLMESRGVTQRWLADAANTKEATISRYINGVNASPNISILIGIAKALDVSTDYLLGLSDVQKQKADFSAEEAVLVTCFRRASTDDKDTMFTLLRKYMTQSDKEFLGLLKDGSK